MKTVLLLTYYFPPAPMALAQRVAKLCKYLPRETHWRPRVICGELPPEICQQRDDALLAEVPDTVPVHRIGSFISSPRAARLKQLHLYKPVSLVRKFLVLPDAHGDWIARAVAAAADLFPGGRGIDAILASGPPNSVYLAGVRLSENWGRPLVLDMRDPWGQHWGKYYWISQWHLRHTLPLETKVYRQATAIIANTTGNAASLSQRFPSYVDKITTIPNGFDPDDLNWEQGLQLHNGNERDMVHLLYLGGVRGAGFEESFFQILSKFFQKYPEEKRMIRVHFVGGDQNHIDKLVKPWGLREVCLGHGIVPGNAVGRPLAEADIYVFLLPSTSDRGCIPSKLYYYLAGNKYIYALIPEGSAQDLIRPLGPLAEIASPGEPDQALEALRRIIQRARKARRPGPTDSFPDCARPFDRRVIARQVGEILDRALAG